EWLPTRSGQVLNEGTFSLNTPRSAGPTSVRLFWGDDVGLVETARGSSTTSRPAAGAILHRSGRLAVQLSNLTTLVDGDVAAGVRKAMRREFDLPGDFKGIGFGGLSVHWLDDDSGIGAESMTETMDGFVSLGNGSSSRAGATNWYVRGTLNFDKRA